MAPSPDPIAIKEKKVYKLLECVRKMENDVYQVVNSQLEYCNVLIEIIRNIQEELGKRCLLENWFYNVRKNLSYSWHLILWSSFNFRVKFEIFFIFWNCYFVFFCTKCIYFNFLYRNKSKNIFFYKEKLLKNFSTIDKRRQNWKKLQLQAQQQQSADISDYKSKSSKSVKEVIPAVSSSNMDNFKEIRCDVLRCYICDFLRQHFQQQLTVSSTAAEVAANSSSTDITRSIPNPGE